ncbi:MAG TPA: molecular chaperone TorD family protein [Terriglobales bacterium]|jgi:nitrate reductase delta subunit
MPEATIYDALATLLIYPDADYPQRIEASVRLAPEECRGPLEQFAIQMRGLATDELQELFTRTFDLNPMCSLELGWHLFGENYERGLLLVRVREELRRHELKESTELPDHLTHVLRLVERMEHEAAADFVAACVLPALEKMLQAMRDKKNPFENVLLAVRSLLHSQFPEIPPATPETEPLLKVLA